jgi:hypothetical protein
MPVTIAPTPTLARWYRKAIEHKEAHLEEHA